MDSYISIKKEVLQTLQTLLPEIQERFGIVTLGLFGSVSRGDDTEKSDIDILYRFRPGMRTYHPMLDLADYLEEKFGRHVELISADWIDPLIKPFIERDVIFLCGEMEAKTVDGFETPAINPKSEA